MEIWEAHRRDTERHLPYARDHTMLPATRTGKLVLLTPINQTGCYLICLLRRNRKLSWPLWLRPQTVTHPNSNQLIATRPEVEVRSHDRLTLGLAS